MRQKQIGLVSLSPNEITLIQPIWCFDRVPKDNFLQAPPQQLPARNLFMLTRDKHRGSLPRTSTSSLLSPACDKPQSQNSSPDKKH